MTDDDDDGLDMDTVLAPMRDATFDADPLGGPTAAIVASPLRAITINSPIPESQPQPAPRVQSAPLNRPQTPPQGHVLRTPPGPAGQQPQRTPPSGQRVQAPPQRTPPSGQRVQAPPQRTPPSGQRVQQPPQRTPPQGEPVVEPQRTPPETVARGSRALDATSAPAGQRPKGFARTDTVPEFRRDLQLTRVEGGYRVSDPVTGREQMLNEYEVSLARMLNGRRPAFEVLEATERLGIPINPESLTKFILMLEQHGFLRPPQALDDAVDKAMDGAWASRGQWESGVRAMFQSGIRLLRMGKHEEAAGYFEAMLAEDPENVEARELLALARNPPVSMQMPAVGSPSMVMAATVPQMVAVPGPISAPMAMATTMPQPVAIPGPMSAPMPMQAAPFAPLQVHPTPRSGLNTWRFPLIASVLIVGGVVGYLVTRGSRKSAQPRSDKPIAAIVADASAGVAALDATVVVMATPDAAEPDAVVAETVPEDAAVVAETVPEDAAVVAEAIDAGAGSAKPVVDGKRAKLQPRVIPRTIGAPIAGEVTSFLATARKVNKGDKLFEIANASADPAKLKTLSAKVAELTALAKQDAVYEPFLADAKAELAKLSSGSKPAIVRAPRAGIATPKVQTGASVRSGQPLAELR